ncbi:aspartate-semialdehyde dehydrogenase [Qipengyuania nanhaisediminis]|uniref:aspartate-semialdehyde dehydrogenase n=1 Tax=Qipengyuania nanhaisediminis TaxID=604088 RepID=UPI0038B27E1E
MRQLAAITAAFLLAACGSNDVPSPAEREAGTEPVSEALAPDRVALHGEGLVAGAEAFYFAAGRSEVEGALAAALGKATDTIEMDECGAGPMTSTVYDGGLTVNFQEGGLVGWILTEASDRIEVDADVTLGMARADAGATESFMAIEDSTLGEEFAIASDKVGGFMEDDRVSLLYAGAQCFMR